MNQSQQSISLRITMQKRSRFHQIISQQTLFMELLNSTCLDFIQQRRLYLHISTAVIKSIAKSSFQVILHPWIRLNKLQIVFWMYLMWHLVNGWGYTNELVSLESKFCDLSNGITFISKEQCNGKIMPIFNIFWSKASHRILGDKIRLQIWNQHSW